MYELANIYCTQGAVVFSQKRQEMIENNERSEDQSMFVDKNTGWEIGRRAFVEEISFDDQGRVIATGAVMEDHPEESATHQAPMSAPSVKGIHQILSVLCPALGIIKNDVQEFVVRIAHDLTLSIETNEQYAFIVSKQPVKDKSKKPDPYETFYHKVLISCVTSALLVRIQTAIPTLPRSHTKTIPSMSPSYEGYPLTDQNNQSGIQYVSFIVHSLKQKQDPIWKHAENPTIVGKRMLKKLETLSLLPEIQRLYEKKGNNCLKRKLPASRYLLCKHGHDFYLHCIRFLPPWYLLPNAPRPLQKNFIESLYV